MPSVLVAVAPMLVAELLKGASAHAAAAVVSSLSMNGVVDARLLQEPMAATRMSAGLLVVDVVEVVPPVATR